MGLSLPEHRTPEEEYDQLVDVLNQLRDETRRRWVALLREARDRIANEEYRRLRLQELSDILVQKREQLEHETSPDLVRLRTRELQAVQLQYFALQLAPQRTTEAVTDARLGHEFDELITNPFVRAVNVIPAVGEVTVFTTQFPYRPSPSSMVGPFRIDVGTLPDRERWGVYAAHSRTQVHPNGAGRSSGFHCFGNVGRILDKLHGDLRVNELLGVMFEAFQSGDNFAADFGFEV